MRTGLHCNTTRNPDQVVDYYRRSGATTFKTLDFGGRLVDGRLLLDVLRGMGVTIIGRNYMDNDRLDSGNLNRIVELAREYPQVHYWEGHNESHQWEGETARYADWEIERMRRLEAVGAKAAIGCFSCGQPQLPSDNTNRRAWEGFLPALRYALARGHALALHEYAGPYMQWMCGANQWDHATRQPKRIDDPCTSPTVEGWLTLRYRKVWREVMIPWGLGALPLFITEGGIDNTDPRPGGQGNGYKNFAGTDWARIPGIGDYAQQRRWYMWQVSHDKYVRGVVDFGFQTADPRWWAFDMSDDTAMLDAVIRAESTLPVGHFASGPVPPVPVPPPSPGPPAPPIVGAVSPSLPFVAIVVAPRDTWWSLGRRLYGAAVASAQVKGLQAANPGALNVGRVLTVPGYRPAREV